MLFVCMYAVQLSTIIGIIYRSSCVPEYTHVRKSLKKIASRCHSHCDKDIPMSSAQLTYYIKHMDLEDLDGCWTSDIESSSTSKYEFDTDNDGNDDCTFQTEHVVVEDDDADVAEYLRGPFEYLLSEVFAVDQVSYGGRTKKPRDKGARTKVKGSIEKAISSVHSRTSSTVTRRRGKGEAVFVGCDDVRVGNSVAQQIDDSTVISTSLVSLEQTSAFDDSEYVFIACNTGVESCSDQGFSTGASNAVSEQYTFCISTTRCSIDSLSLGNASYVAGQSVPHRFLVDMTSRGRPEDRIDSVTHGCIDGYSRSARDIIDKRLYFLAEELTSHNDNLKSSDKNGSESAAYCRLQ